MSHAQHATLLDSRFLPWTGITVLMALFASVAPLIAAEVESESWRDSHDPAARLWRSLEAGEVKLDTSTEASFLKDLLHALDVPVESQVLVFSKTSLQKSHIDPHRPRAIYYNEDTYVGWVQGGDLEIAASDPNGEMQYYLIQRKTKNRPLPALIRSNQCLSCHVGGALQIQSVHTRDNGYPMGNEDRFVTTYESPLSERWGGWYVTGRHGSDLHMGNVTVEPAAGGITLNRQRGANVESLDAWVSLEAYPVGTSDIVALMVLEHQYVLHNALHEAAKTIRRLQEHPSLPEDEARRVRGYLSRALQKRAGEIADLLLYLGEYPLKNGGIAGNPSFQNAFRRNVKTSQRGDSLKDFDLGARMFKHRCSYMIHSATFKGLPEILRQAVYVRLDEILSGRDDNDEYDHLPAEERQTIRQILLETEPDATTYWHAQ